MSIMNLSSCVASQTLYVLWMAFTISLTNGAKTRSIELVYDTEAANLPDSVPKYISITGCYFMCLGADCTLLENQNDNFCMLILTILVSKGGNVREGHFDDKYYSNLPDDRADANCISRQYGSMENFETDNAIAANGPITGYQVWNERHLAGIQMRYGDVWGKKFGETPPQPFCYVQLARDERIIETITRSAMWIDNLKITSSFREYPDNGGTGGYPYTTTGTSLRYIGAGDTQNAIDFYHSTRVIVSGLRLYFIC